MFTHIFRLLGSKPNPARDLAIIGHRQRHDRIIAKAEQMRAEMGLAPDPRLKMGTVR